MPTPLTSSFNAHHTTAPAYKGPRLRTGQLVTWRNPSTGAHHSGVRVEFVYPHLGLVLLRGDFGRVNLRTGAPSPETKRVRIDQVTVDPVPADASVVEVAS